MLKNADVQANLSGPTSAENLIMDAILQQFQSMQRVGNASQ